MNTTTETKPKENQAAGSLIYEFITPSDPITFRAIDDKVAFVCGLWLGNAKAFVEREDGHKVNTCFLFAKPEVIEAAIKDTLDCTLDAFITNNHAAVAECFESFAYGTVESRKQYDDAIAAITDEKKLAEFKASHENRNRSSIRKWVRHAWEWADGVREKYSTQKAA